MNTKLALLLLLFEEMGKSTSSLVSIYSRLIIRGSLPIHAFTYSTNYVSSRRENAKIPNKNRN